MYKKDWKQKLEDFIESKNGIIQVVYFSLLLICSGLFAIGKQSVSAIMIELLGVISLELVTLNIKDSISHRKLNRLGVTLEKERGNLIRMSDFDLTSFFKNCSNDLFISGIALNFIFERFKSEIIGLLKEGKEINIVITDPDLIPECAKLYYGIRGEENKTKSAECDIYGKQLMTLNCIRNSNELYQFFLHKNLKIRIAKNVFSTSFVAYDIFKPTEIEKKFRKYFYEIKASFYQYGCTVSSEEPGIVVNTKENGDWYEFFKQTINRQWNDSEQIKDSGDFSALLDRLSKKSNSCFI